MSLYNKNDLVLEELILFTTSNSSFTINQVNLALLKQDDKIIECCLKFPINYELYQQIEQQNLFNLKPEVKSPITGGKFLPEIEINLEITLKPDILPQLLETTNNPEEIANYLVNLSQQQSENKDIHPLLQTENWLCLSVKQTQNNKEIGYNTFWYYVNPSVINNPDTTSEQVSEGIVNFVKEWTQVNLATATQNFTNDILTDIGNIFQDFSNEIFLEPGKQDTIQNNPETLFDSIINFFDQDDWSYVKIEDNTALRLAFEGDNGRWNCYAKAREEQKQFIFYSICPVQIPEDKRLTISEFITRANYGMINGNFELDFNDGEIRYKTSIDVDGDKLSFALIKNLVYANVIMMDEYLPGIINVIESDISPELAINPIEQNQEINQSSDEIEQLPLIIAVDEQKEDIKTQNRNPYILAILTPEEIAQFHHALQVMPPYQ
ncbi:hypothetical protein FJR38_12300, partial [Anabaena sp. UHCC 0253]|uniref:YbjN domain-containing protein n=1 Tax=Anabaena sp. UHCC 0253 TaxID=2590019 RepID=UPI001446C02B